MRDDLDRLLKEIDYDFKSLETKINKAHMRVNQLKKQTGKPMMDQTYYFLTILGAVETAVWQNSDFDKAVRKSGSGFFTKEKAELESISREVKQEVGAFSRDFRYGNDNFYISYSYSDHAIVIDKYRYNQQAGFCFDSEEKIQEMIKTVGDERIKKYYLGVENG